MDRRNFLSSTSKSVLGSIVTPQCRRLLPAESGLSGDDRAETECRQRISFDDGWKFFLGNVSNGESSQIDDKSWQKIDLPHDWSIEGPFREDNPSGAHGAYLPGGIGWYRKTFTLPPASKGKHVEVEFEGIYQNSDVWINGHHLGSRPYGYVSFSYDLTPYLQFGENANIMAVRVDNSRQPNSRWYSGSGIYRHVWITSTAPLRVDYCGTFIRTRSISSRFADMAISIRIKNSLRETAHVRLVTTVHGVSGHEAGQVVNIGAIPANGEHAFTQHLRLADPQLWSPYTPKLYRAVTHVYSGTNLMDEYITPFGIRSIHFDSNAGFFLNGQSVKIKGVCLHHDLGALGAAFNCSAMEYRLRLLKGMGCNAIRTAHNPPAPRLLDLCDEMGFLVMDEAFDEWDVGKHGIPYGYHCYFGQWASMDLRSMILRDRNHPSVILWSVGNEIRNAGTAEGAKTAKMLADIVREEDPSRPVTCAIHKIETANKSGFPDVFDVAGYNGGGGSSFQYDADHERYPSRKIFGSEAPHTAQTRGIYVSDENYCSSYDSCFERMSSEGAWKLIKERPFVAGAFRWSGFDYLGEPTPHEQYHIASRDTLWPARSADKGVIDTCCLPKDIYYFYQSQWTSDPMVHILPHWNWEGMEGKPIFVWCYTNCDSVELFLNDRSLGPQHRVSTAAYHLTWEVPYTSGTLRAVGYRGESEVCHKEVHTAGPPSSIALSCLSSRLLAKDRDIAHIRVEIVDRNGVLVPCANNSVRFEVQGEGQLVGVDNGDPLSHQSFRGTGITAFQGQCLALVQVKDHAGQISIRATSPGLDSAAIALQST